MEVSWKLTTFGSASKPEVNKPGCLEHFDWSALIGFLEMFPGLTSVHFREEGAGFGPCQDFLRAVQPDNEGAGDQRGGERSSLQGARLHECSSAAS